MQVVVGAVLTDGAGRILAARRASPPGWELPGGKVEPGETEPAALVRELREELGVTIQVGGRVGPDVPIGTGLVLHAWTAALTAGEPTPLEHAELRWLAPAELGSVDWLPADRPIAAALAGAAGDRPPRGDGALAAGDRPPRGDGAHAETAGRVSRWRRR